MADSGKQRRLARVLGGILAMALVAGFVWFVHSMMLSKNGKPTRQVQIVQIIRPPPPPPDKPPPPPPEKAKEVLPKDEPPPDQPQQAPAAQPLALDAEGSAGADAFGLGARPVGSDLVGGTGSAPFAWYQGRISDVIHVRLASLDCAKSMRQSLSLHLQMETSGKIMQVQLATTTGNLKMDQCIDAGLSSGPPMSVSDPLPPGMPEKVTVRIVARI
jgi:protein TonB